ncbi:zinc dependent phospholipase C family protein [Oricola sp.]|uniref:zinc dependent phospholipase C family protein n=1 Tax=Oricola sp. TaxID=1979950 RepID=UPI003BA91FAB
MMSQTHILMAAALFARPGRPRQNAALVAGAFAPDAAIYGLFLWSKLAGIPERTLWREIYFAEPMLTLTAIGNSLPLYAGFLALGITLISLRTANGGEALPLGDTPTPLENTWQAVRNSAIAMFALGAIVHLAGDFPVHAADAHPHFWPLSDWRFQSPVSYWDRNYYGDTFAFFEMLLGVALAVIVFRRFKALWVRALCALAICAYVGVPLYFTLMLG